MSGSKARYLAELEEFELSKSDDHRRESGARLSGAGKAVTAVGLIGGGIPGVKPTNSWSYSAAGGSPRGLTVRNLRTGVLGTRIGAHESQVSYLHSKKRGDAYVKGRREGKLVAEHNVLRGMKRAHRGAYGVTAAGLGLVAAGHQRQKVNKADDLKRERRFGATATTAGLTGGVLAPTLGGFGRHYRKQAAGHLDAAERLAPTGKTKSTVLRRQIGVHHGHAAAAGHFADVFHGHAKLFGAVGAGSGVLALRQARHKQSVKKGSGTIDPGVPVQTKYRMVGSRRVELDPKDYGKDLNPYRARLRAAEDARKKRQGKSGAQLRLKSAADRDKYFKSPSGKRWMRNNAPGRKGRITWGPEDGKTNTTWRKRQGFSKGLPELPLGNIPRNAIHASHGKVRVLAYHGDNRFTVLKGDSKIIAHRSHLTFLPERKSGGGVSKVHKPGLVLLGGEGGMRNRKALMTLRGVSGRKMVHDPLARTPVAQIARQGRTENKLLSLKGEKPRTMLLTQTPRATQFRKRDGQPLKTSINEHDASRLVAEHGLTGPLPKHLNREQRMAAYEARYVTAGGHKAHKWQHRANEAEKVRVTGVGAGTAAGAVWLAAHGKHVKARLPHLKHKSELALGGAGVTAGAGELYGAHARKKRSSYASAPAGVASSALRRMQGYTPQEH